MQTTDSPMAEDVVVDLVEEAEHIQNDVQNIQNEKRSRNPEA